MLVIVRTLLFLVIGLAPLYVVRFSMFLRLGTVEAELPTTLLEVVVGLFVLVWCVWWVRLGVSSRKLVFGEVARRLRGVRGLVAFSLLFVVGSVIGLVLAPDAVAGFGLWRAYVLEPVLVVVLGLFVVRKADVEMIVRVLGVSALAVSVVAVVQWVFGVGLLAPWDGVIEPVRATSVFPYPNAVGLYVVPVLGLYGALVFWRSGLWDGVRRWRAGLDVVGVFEVAVVVAGLGALVVARSRGALLAVAVVWGLMVMLSRYRWRLVGGVVVVAGAVLGVADGVREGLVALLSGGDVSSDVRLVLWQGSWRVVRESWLVGVGIGGFPAAYDLVREAKHVELLLYPHFFVFNFLVEFGLAGLLGVVGVVLGVMKRVLGGVGDVVARGGRGEVAWRTALGVGVVVALLVMMLHGVVDVPYFKNDLAMQFWVLILLGLLVV